MKETGTISPNNPYPSESKPVNNRRLLLPVLVILLILEWIIDLVEKLWNIFHISVKEITLALESYINEPTGPKTKNGNEGS